MGFVGRVAPQEQEVKRHSLILVQVVAVDSIPLEVQGTMELVVSHTFPAA